MNLPSDEVMIEFQKIADDLARAETEKEELQGMIRTKEMDNTKSEIELKSGISQLKLENEKLLKRYLKEHRKVQILEKHVESNSFVQEAQGHVETEKAKFRETALKLIEQVEYLRTVYPFEKMLQIKDQEIAASGRLLSRVSSRHPDRGNMESVHNQHLAQREDIIRVIRESRKVLAQMRSEIEQAMGNRSRSDDHESEYFGFAEK